MAIDDGESIVRRAEKVLDDRRSAIVEAYSRIAREKGHFVVLGLSRDATEAEVKAAYFRLATEFHPDTLGELANEADRIQAIFLRLNGAFDVLGQAKKRAAYEATLEPPVAHAASPEDVAFRAEENLKRAEELLREEEYWEVIQLLDGQIGALTGRPRQEGGLLLAQAYLHNPNWLQKAEEVLRTVIQEDPSNAEAYYLLGTIYKSRGLANRAAEMFRKSRKLGGGSDEGGSGPAGAAAFVVPPRGPKKPPPLAAAAAPEEACPSKDDDRD